MVPHLYKIIKDNMAYNKYRLNVMFVTTFFFSLSHLVLEPNIYY